MSSSAALRERARKVTDVAKGQMHAYLGGSDYMYEQSRRRSPAIDFRGKLSELKDASKQPRGWFGSEARTKVRDSVQSRMDAARERRAELGTRGERIVADWRSAVVVKDAKALINTVRQADGAGEIAKGLGHWLTDFPVEPTGSRGGARKRSTGKPTARKTPARKSATTGPAARKTATTRSANKSTS